MEKPKQKWGGFGWVCLVGNISLMAFYTCSMWLADKLFCKVCFR